MGRGSTPLDPVPVDERVRRKARSLGFHAVGIARADEPLGIEFDRYRDFVERGLHGTMDYLARDLEARRALDQEAILPGARSVICLARRYARGPEAESTDPPLAQRIARYARGQDYHNYVRKKLRLLAKFVRTLGPDVQARPLLDEEPVLERAWAARAGLGFVGKHGLLIVPGQGSYVLLGEVVTTLALTPSVPMAERCGSCTRCLDACPTRAFERPFVLDPRRCIAYLTIEDRSPSPSLEPSTSGHLFGCDDCQSVCPFNRTAAPPASDTRIFEPLDAWAGVALERLVAQSDAEFAELTTGSPVRRATRVGLARAAVRVAASALDEPEAAAAVLVLESARSHDDPSVRALAEQALARRRP